MRGKKSMRGKKIVSFAVTSALLLGSASCIGKEVQAAKKITLDKEVKITVNTTRKLKLTNNKKKVVWKVVSGAKRIQLKNKRKDGVDIVANEVGSAKITAKVGTKKYTCKVTIKVAPRMMLTGTKGRNASDVAVLQNLLNYQLAKNPYSAEYSKEKLTFDLNEDDENDSEDGSQYRWNEDGRLVEIFWLQRDVWGNVCLSDFAALEKVHMESCSGVTGLDVSGCGQLKSLFCAENKALEKVNIAGCSALEWMWVNGSSTLKVVMDSWAD